MLKVMFIMMVFPLIHFHLFILFNMVNADIKMLESGSFDEQTYGKNGIVLLYDDASEEQLMYFLTVAEKFKDDDKIHFWHLNCNLAEDFCAGRDEFHTLPVMLYSFRNELWEGQECDDYKEHAFETFFRTKVEENCLTVPSLCTEAMNQTLEIYGESNHTVLKKAYLEEKDNGDDVEKEWNEISQKIQNDFMQKRLQFQNKLRMSDERVKILGLLMEKKHSESYESNKGEKIKIEIDQRNY